MHKKYTEDELRAIANLYTTRNTFKDGHYGAYSVAVARGLLDKLCGHMHAAKRGYKPYITDEQVAAAFKRHPQLGKVKRGPDASFYRLAGYRYGHGSPTWQAITAHMEPPINFGRHAIYAFEFSDRHAYVGQTANTKRRFADHLKKGPIQAYVAANPAVTHTIKILEVDVHPSLVGAREGHWQAHYIVDGWIPLWDTTCKPGGLGCINPEATKAGAHRAALLCTTRNEFWTRFQTHAKRARKNGWYGEITAHMPAVAPVSDETRARQSAAAAARPVDPERLAKMTAARQRNVAARQATKALLPVPEKLVARLGQAECAAAAAQCTSRGEFSRRFRHRYNVAKKNGWFEAICAHMPTDLEVRRTQARANSSRPVSEATRARQSASAKARCASPSRHDAASTGLVPVAVGFVV